MIRLSISTMSENWKRKMKETKKKYVTSKKPKLENSAQWKDLFITQAQKSMQITPMFKVAFKILLVTGHFN